MLASLLLVGLALVPAPFLAPLPGRAGCVTQGGEGHCGPGRALQAVSGLVVTEDVRFVYAAVRDSGAVAAFRRDPRTGALRQLAERNGCLGGAPRDPFKLG